MKPLSIWQFKMLQFYLRTKKLTDSIRWYIGVWFIGPQKTNSRRRDFLKRIS